MTQVKTYKFKLKPTKKQEETFSRWLGVTRFMYNLCLEYKIIAYRNKELNVSKNDVQKELKETKNDFPWMKEVHSQVIQDVTDRLFRSYDNFFKRVKTRAAKPGFPKFKNKKSWSSFKFKQGMKLYKNVSKIYLPSIGDVKFIKSQEIIGNVCTASVRKEHDGWYITITTENINHKTKEAINAVIAFDLGLTNLITTSEGEVIENPKTLKKYEEKIAKLQRNLARKNKGSKNFYKDVLVLQRLYAKVTRIREDFLHKLSTKVINENQVIICEDLSVSNMIKNHCLAKSISDASCGKFVSMLEYKSIWAGRMLIKVSPRFTTQDCSTKDCSYRNGELTLADREWTCPECHTHHNRDVNAAKNIEERGFEELNAFFIKEKKEREKELKRLEKENNKNNIKKEQEAGYVFSTLGVMVKDTTPAGEPLVTELMQNISSGLQESYVL